LGKLAVKWGVASSLDEFYALSHEITTATAKMDVKEASGKTDLIVIQTALTLDDLNKTLNLLMNRLREWYGNYFPELNGLVDNSAIYTRLVGSIGERNNFSHNLLTKMGVRADSAAAIITASRASMGGELREQDIAECRSFAQAILELDASRSRIEQYLDGLMKEIAPNTRELGGSTLGARLIAQVGGLENLAKRSSSTIQLLGAEAALFRSLKTGARPPKHGLIFQHKDIHQSPRRQRGKIARALAGKIAIAARLDAYGGRYRGDDLKAEFRKRVEEIKTKRAEQSRKAKK
jgi:nucleolar protein 56